MHTRFISKKAETCSSEGKVATVYMMVLDPNLVSEDLNPERRPKRRSGTSRTENSALGEQQPANLKLPETPAYREKCRKRCVRGGDPFGSGASDQVCMVRGI